jgi:hypothetical protein
MTYYGSPAQVAVFVPRYADKFGKFTQSTRPTLAQVELWLEQVSGVLNAYLASKGWATPVTDTDLAASLALFTSEEVAAMVEGANGSGRFGPTSPDQSGQSRFAIIRMDVMEYIDSLLVGNQVTSGSSATIREDAFSL